MRYRILSRCSCYGLVLAVLFMTACVGCGMLTDKDRIRIAKLIDVHPATGEPDERYITRGDLSEAMRNMPDDERPVINNKGDLLRALRAYIDERIRTLLVQQVIVELEAQGKELLSREQAKQSYFAKHSEENFAAIYNLKNPASVGMTQQEFDAQKTFMDGAIDLEYNKLLGQNAVAYQAAKDYKDGTLQVTDADYDQEFKIRKDELKTFEWIKFRAIRFPATMPNATGLAADTRSRMTDTQSFYEVYKEFEAKTRDFVMESEIQNDPAIEKFQGFWRNAAGCKTGDILGPIYLPEHQIQADVQGRAQIIEMPAAYLVLEVLKHRDEAPMALEDAKSLLSSSILIAKEMEKLRRERGVEIFEDNLPDPDMFSQQMDNGKMKF